MVKKDVHHRIPEITAGALSAKTKNSANNKAPHDDRLLDPRPGLFLTSADKRQIQARLELIDQLNAEEVGVEVFKLTEIQRTDNLSILDISLLRDCHQGSMRASS